MSIHLGGSHGTNKSEECNREGRAREGRGIHDYEPLTLASLEGQELRLKWDQENNAFLYTTHCELAQNSNQPNAARGS